MVFASVRDNRTFSVPNPALTPSRKPLPAMLGQPHRTTRFDRLTTDICRTNGESWKPNRVSTNEKTKINMANFYCKWCGSKYSSVTSLTSGSCSKNPEGKKHGLYEGSEKSQYVCKCCGSKYSSLTSLCSGSCSKSPTKKHQPAM